MIIFNIILFSVLSLVILLGAGISAKESFPAIREYLGFRYGDDL